MPSKKRILIVDDEADYTATLRERLEFEGYTVIEALEGRAALDFLRSSAVDLIILDLMMPEVDGFEFLKGRGEVNEATAKTPIIVVTAFSEQLTQKQLGLIVDIPRLRKPFKVERLLKLMGEMTGR